MFKFQKNLEEKISNQHKKINDLSGQIYRLKAQIENLRDENADIKSKIKRIIGGNYPKYKLQEQVMFGELKCVVIDYIIEGRIEYKILEIETKREFIVIEESLYKK